MFEQLTIDIILLLMLYSVGATASAGACIYLLFRRGNAFAPKVKTSKRLRRWTAAFFGIVAAGHFWYLPASMVTDDEAATLWMLIGGLLDCLLTLPVAIIMLLCMLQDRRRPLWPVWVAVAPLVILMAVSVGMRSYALLPWMRGYLLLMGICFTVYMARAVCQYGHWLRDNFADLEHKEVWQSFVVLAVVVLMFGIYASGDGGMAYELVIQVCALLMVAYLLWRVETLQSLEQDVPLSLSVSERSDGLASETVDKIECLLRDHCEATQLYLQRDLTVSQLAQVLGINRFYLSQYFSRKNTTYNTYINTLRIAHFEHLYRDTVSSHLPVSAKFLAARCGYRSYSTFSLAFKQRTGQSVTSWMRQMGHTE